MEEAAVKNIHKQEHILGENGCKSNIKHTEMFQRLCLLSHWIWVLYVFFNEKGKKNHTSGSQCEKYFK